jgi:hypothetical protein
MSCSLRGAQHGHRDHIGRKSNHIFVGHIIFAVNEMLLRVGILGVLGEDAQETEGE